MPITTVLRAAAVRAASLFLVAGVTVVAVVLLALHTPTGQRVDERVLRVTDAGVAATRTMLEALGLVSVLSVAVVLGALMLFAVLRRRLWSAVVALVLVTGANVATQVLKATLVRPDLGGRTANTLPSGHTTVAFSLGLAMLVVLPNRWRPVQVAAVAGMGTFVGASTVIGGWHLPSDVVAAFAVAGAWAGLSMLLALPALRSPDPVDRGSWAGGRPARRALAYGLYGLTASALAGVVLVVGGLSYGGRPRDLLLVAVGLSAIGVAAALLAAAAALACDSWAGLESGHEWSLPAREHDGLGPSGGHPSPGPAQPSPHHQFQRQGDGYRLRQDHPDQHDQLERGRLQG